MGVSTAWEAKSNSQVQFMQHFLGRHRHGLSALYVEKRHSLFFPCTVFVCRVTAR